MRFVSINNVKEGMVLAKQLVGKNNELLLNHGTVLVSSYIKKIKALGYPGIYVEDELSRDINISEVIDENLKQAAVKSIKDTFSSINEGKKISLKHLDDINNIVNNIIDNVLNNKDAMVNMIDLKVFDDYTFYHSVNVSVLTLVIGVALGYNRDQLYRLALASVLHDIGKMFIPKQILNKKGILNKDEYEIVKTHSQKGYSYVKENFEIPTASYIGILHHHEKYNGNGYPTNLNGKK